MKLGRNDPCWCGSGKKFKRCHLDGRSNSVASSRRTVLNEAELIEAFKSSEDRRLRDPRELALYLADSGKPLLVVDERRIHAGGAAFVFFSLVALPGSVALDALLEIAELHDRHPRLLEMSGSRMLRERSEDAHLLRETIKKYLSKAHVLRAGVTYDSLRAWKRETGWPGVVTVQNKIRIKEKEYAVLQNLVMYVVGALRLRGLVIMAVDSSMQNGLDPQQTRVDAGELGAITFDVPKSEAHAILLATTPEDPTAGGWIRIADLDTAVAVESPEFDEFAKRVRTAPQDGKLIYWHVKLPAPES